jgi:hypothetical protein
VAHAQTLILNPWTQFSNNGDIQGRFLVRRERMACGEIRIISMPTLMAFILVDGRLIFKKEKYMFKCQ